MNCNFRKDLLALHISQDLAPAQSQLVSDHIQRCGECRTFLDQLGHRQSQLRLLRADGAQSDFSSDVAALRRNVLAQIGESNSTWRWFRFERLLLLGFRRHAFAFCSLAVAVVVSATLFAQMRQSPPKISETAAVFSGKDSLVLPDNYRNWVLVGNSSATTAGSPHSTKTGGVRNIYMDRRGYREFSRTGVMPEGAVLILELSSGPQQKPFALQASVKDSRFDGGWGFFNFTGTDGRLQSQAPSILDYNTCRSCHEKRAPFDHVFTTVQEIMKTAANFEQSPHSLS